MNIHIHCPHCKNPIELVDFQFKEEVTCTACGSSFRLEDMSTTGWAGGGKPIGRFEVLEEVGHGAFGTVYKARDPQLDRTVALKVPRQSNIGDKAQDLERFIREARSVAQLRHPSIVAVHEVGTHDGTPHLVSDFVEGITLADVLTARRPAPREAAQLIADVAEALHYAHEQGVVHRDVKPSNIMLRDEGRGARDEGRDVVSSLAPHPSSLDPVVMDFGLAKRDAGEITMTMDGDVLGTPAYMTPEQARGEGHRVDGKSDVYSLGVILYQLLTGELPFRGNKRMRLHQVLHEEPKAPRSFNDHISRDLETITLKAMAKEAGRRYATAHEMAEDLRRWLKGEPILARPVGRIERVWRWSRRNPLAASLACGLVATLLLGTTISTMMAIAASRETAKLKAERERSLAAGALDITDPGLLHVRNFDSSRHLGAFSPQRFIWRVYLPPQGKYRLVACFATEFRSKPPHDGYLEEYHFTKDQQGREIYVSVTLAQQRNPHLTDDKKGEWAISMYAEGDPLHFGRPIPSRYNSSFRKKTPLSDVLDSKTTYRLGPDDNRMGLLRWEFSEDDAFSVLAGKAKLGGLRIWLERAQPDGTFATDALVQ